MQLDFTHIRDVLFEQFTLGDWSLHGPDHWVRVERNGLALARVNGADETVVRLFALFHDSQRHNESYDPEHGQRAAAFARQQHGDLFAVSDDQLTLLCLACEWHHRGAVSDDVTVGTCFDADRLDLPRVGITPDPSKMSTAVGREYARNGRLPLV